MSNGGFSVLCGANGVVIADLGNDGITAGSPLVLSVAPASRERMWLLLTAARDGDQHSAVQLADDTPVEVHCAGEDGRTLVIAGPDAAALRARCAGAVEVDPSLRPLAARIEAAIEPDKLSLDLWADLARLNNDLATAQRQLAKNNAELRWLNEQKNQLLGMAAHDLRNPLASILAYSTFILDDEALSSEGTHMVQRIQANVKTMLAMVEDVLDFSAIESGTVRLDLAAFPADDLIRDVVEVHTAIAGRKDIVLATEIDPATPLLYADRRKLAQVLDNLVSNAIKFSHRSSPVSIGAGRGDGGEVWLTVSDRGPGMSPEQTTRLFEPFSRVGVQATGGERSTGLGLSIARRIVDAHRGRIDVSSEPGRGTTFTVVLPVGPASAREE